MAKTDSNKKNIIKTDGWDAVFNAMAEHEEYKQSSRVINFDHLTLTTAWEADGIAAKIMTKVVKDGTREGFTLNENQEKYSEVYKRLNYIPTKRRFEALGRVYGGAVMYYVYDDTDEPAEKLKPSAKLVKIHTFDRFQVIPDMNSLNTNPKSEFYGMPEYYDIKPLRGTDFTVHASRLLVNQGIETSDYTRDSYGDGVFGVSALQPSWKYLEKLVTSLDNANTNLENFTFTLLKMQNLQGLINNKQEEQISKRLRIIEKGLRIGRIVLTDALEDFDRKSGSLTGVNTIIQEDAQALAASANMPVTLLMGRSPSGMNSTGESDVQIWNNEVRDYQTHVTTPFINDINMRILNSEPGFKDKLPDVNHNPLKHLDQQQTVDTRKKQAETDQIYFDMGMVFKEIYDMRFLNGYSFSMDPV